MINVTHANYSEKGNVKIECVQFFRSWTYVSVKHMHSLTVKMGH